MTATATPPRPTPVSARALGPDLARGGMLLFIALANSHYFLRGATVLGGYPQDGSALDRAVIWLLATFVDGRAFPLFGALFGYGVARIADRQRSLGPRGVRRLLWRRSLVLVVVGVLDALLFFAGDILAAYGVLLLLGAWCVRWRNGALLATAALFLVLTALPGDGSLTISSDPPHAAMLPPDLAAVLPARAQVSLYVALLGPIGFVCPFLIGLWAGRARLLERPEQHRRLLRGTAWVGLGAAALGAQPVALILAGVVDSPARPVLELLGPLHDATGILGGFGYAALLSLLAVRLGARPRPVTTAIAAVGQRSMTCYLVQSVVWSVVFTPFLLDLSGALSVTATALLAAATWLATVVLADRMRRRGRRGPFEALIRRVTYGRAVAGAPAAGPDAGQIGPDHDQNRPTG
ncbi:DUF418 domain-containing protein [Amorphoplanes nipponensis]|nr:DUF418 domain-containing protein [Actinoplanes nipponensis]